MVPGNPEAGREVWLAGRERDGGGGLARRIYFEKALYIFVVIMNDFFPGEGRKKITSLFNTERRYNRSGSITTATNDKEDNIRQSRIMNLPNYKKQTMECRLDFVVVFQTMEIERLSVQIESLRVRLADSERQILNYKNYQVQIKELTERCFDFEKEKNQYEEQINYLAMCLKQVQHENANFKDKMVMLEEAYREQEDHAFNLKEKLIIEQKQREQSQEGRLLLESSVKQKQKLYSRQLKEMEKSTQFKRHELTKNQEHLGNLLKKYHEEVNTLQKENLSLRNLYDTIEQQSQDLERRYEELQQELFRNNDILKQKDFQLQGMENENNERLEIIQHRYEEQYDTKCKRIEEYEQEVIDWRNQVERLEHDQEKYELKINQYSQQCQKYQNLLNSAGDQIDRLNTIIKDKIKYLEAWQGRFKELQDNFNAAQNTLNTQHQKIAVDEEEITRISHALKFKSEQLDKLQKNREQEVKAVKEKLQQIEVQRQEITAIKRQKQLQREDQRRKELQNAQIKQQLNKRIIEGNKLFEDLNQAETHIQQIKVSLAAGETALRIKDEELKKAKDEIISVDHRIEKLQNEKRALQQEAMRVKALQQRIKHEENKKNEYLNECKKLSQKLKESEKQLVESRRKRKELEKDLQRFQKYTEQLLEKVKDYEEKLDLMGQLRKQMTFLLKTNQNNEQQIERLYEAIALRSNELNHCKQKIMIFDKYMKEFKVKEEQYKHQLQAYQKLEGELRTLKAKYEKLEDKSDKLEGDLATTLAEIDQLAKENGSLERVIEINNQELKRTETLLEQAKMETQNLKNREKEVLSKIKQNQKSYKHANQQVEKEKEKLLKQKNELQKQLDKKNKEFQSELKAINSDKQKYIRQKEKQLKQKESQRIELEEEINSFRILIKKSEEEKQRWNKNCKQLEKRVLAYEHELERNSQSNTEATKQLEIAKKNIQKMVVKAKETEELVKEQNQRLGDLLTDKERLLVEINDRQRITTGKEQDITQLLRENKMFQNEISALRDDLSVQLQRDSALCEELIRVKFQAESVNSSYNSLNNRLSNLHKMIIDLKANISKAISINTKLQAEKTQIEKKYLEYQQTLTVEIERLEEEQYKAGEEIIRLDTINRILQIELGQYKERESAVISIVKEGSILKERKQTTPIRTKDRIATEPNNADTPSKKNSTNASRFLDKSTLNLNLKESRMLKSSIFGEENQMLRSRCVTTRFDDDLVDTSLCEKKDSPKGENPLQKSKRIYFQNLVFKPI